MKIDVFCHLLPPRYLAERNRRAGSSFGTQYARYFSANPGLIDLEIRFRILDKYPDVRQLLTIAGPNIESITEPRDSVELAQIANDEMAALVAKHPIGLSPRPPALHQFPWACSTAIPPFRGTPRR